MSQFVGFLEPPGDALSGYNSKQLHSAQPDGNVPEIFRDAMSVREEVYVEEQGIPLENEFDYDDARSFHWVAYASVGTSAAHPEAPGSPELGANGRHGSTANKLAVGTIRLVPPPHPPHPAPGSSHKIDNAEGVPPDVQAGLDHAKTHDSKEPYVKIGRLAVLKPFRGLGLAALLINAALTWAGQHPEDVLPPMSPTAAEHRRLELGGLGENDDHWKGLVLIHAQKSITEKVWAKYGFVKDDSMGEWDEEGIAHVAMWKRIETNPLHRRSSVISPLS